MFGESSFFNHHEDRQPENYKGLSEALELADKRVFKYAINPDDFIKPSGPYERRSVEKDKSYVKRRKADFNQEYVTRSNPGHRIEEEKRRELAHVFEAVVLDNMDSNEWLGPEAQIIVPAQYDDIAHGIDGIVELDRGGYFSHLALAMDMTTSEDVSRKLLRIKEAIDEGHLAKIHYFASEAMHFKGEKRNVPQVVIGADRKTVVEVMQLWVERKNNALAKHALQFQIMNEIIFQLRAFRDYSERKGKNRIADILETSLDTITEISNRQREQYGDNLDKALSAITKDEVYQTLKNEVEKLFES